jgi:bile acid-coenzyme A ligase
LLVKEMPVVSGEPSYVQRLRLLAAESPDAVAVRHALLDGSEPALTFAELDRYSDQLAGAFAERGLGFGDRLGIGLHNSPQLVGAVFAAWKLGAIPVPARWDLPEWELERLKDVIDGKLFLGPEDVEWIDEATQPGQPIPDLPDLLSPHANGICSSGSTGTPKVILLDRPAVVEPTLATPFIFAWRQIPLPQTLLVPTAMYHTNGFSTLNNMLAGEQLIVLEKFDAARVVDLVERYRITTFIATPTMLQRIADLPGIERRDLSSIQWIMQGAAPMPRSLVHRWADLIGADRIVMAYGMTEGLGLTALNGEEWMQRPGSVGRGFRGTEIRIRGEEGELLSPGEIGEIYLRAPFYGGYRYLGEAPRLQSDEDGFQTAGDMGYLDEDGYLYLVDRRVDMIVTGGANVFPAEVEAALIDHPGIADIVVIGLSDEQWGRRVHVILEPSDPANPPTEAQVIEFAKGRLAAYKVPKSVEVIDALPRSASTKINRGALVAARGG